MPETFTLPPRSKVGYLDPEIAGEGQKVLLSDGEQVSWNPPPEALVIPDYTKIKSLAKYFNRRGGSPYPAWIFHPSEAPRVIKNAEDGEELGIRYRQTTPDERARFGHQSVWDWDDGCEWRVKPFPKDLKFDVANPGQGKIYVASVPTPRAMQHELLEAVLPQVTAAVLAALKTGGAPAAPTGIGSKDWEEFQQFLAFKKSAQALDVVGAEIEKETADVGAAPASALSAPIEEDDERAAWEAEAQRLGVKIDGRWSIKRLKEEIEKAA